MGHILMNRFIDSLKSSIVDIGNFHFRGVPGLSSYEITHEAYNPTGSIASSYLICRLHFASKAVS
jgi:hypothetical protein